MLSAILALAATGCDWSSKKKEAQRELLVRANRAVDAQQMFYANVPGAMPRYAQRLEELMAFQPELTSDPGLTFRFARTAPDYFDFTLVRAEQDWSVRCTADSDCVLIEPKKKRLF